MSELNDLDLIRDQEERYRRLTWHVRDLHHKHEVQEATIQRVQEALPGKRPAWLPMVLTACLTLLLTYISIVHQVATRARDSVIEMQGVQQRNLHLIESNKDIEARLRVVEGQTRQVPGIAEQLQAIQRKLDQALEQR